MPEHLTVVAGKTVKELFQEHVLKFSQQWRKEMVRMYVSRSFLLFLIVSSSVFLLSTNFSSHFISPFYYLFFFFSNYHILPSLLLVSNFPHQPFPSPSDSNLSIESSIGVSYVEVFGDQVSDLLKRGSRCGHSKVRT